MEPSEDQSFPSPEQSAVIDKLECLYNLLYLADRILPQGERTTEDLELQHHLGSIRAHLDAMRDVLLRLENSRARC